MKSYLILGLGRFGQSLAKALSGMGHDVLAVDRDEHLVQEISDEITHVMCAESSNEDFLKSIGVTNFDAAVVAIGNDIQSSILTTVLLKELGAKYVLAKAQSDLHSKVLYKVGADKVILPERDMGIRAANSLVSNSILDVIEFSPEYSIVEVVIPESWIGKTIGSLSIRVKYGLNVIAIRNKKSTNISPQAETVFQKNDVIAVMGKNSDLGNLRYLE